MRVNQVSTEISESVKTNECMNKLFDQLEEIRRFDMTSIRKMKIVFLAVLVLALFFSCSKDSTEPQETPPTLPPASVFLMEFESFPLSDQGDTPAGITQQHQNWGWAATNVLVWNTVLFVNLAIPVAAFQASFQQQPVKLDDGSWMWSYSFPALGVQHTAKLQLSLENNLAHWKMYISRDGQFADFLWFEGEGDLGDSHGIWTVYSNPSTSAAYLEIEWNRNPQDNTGDIKNTNILQEDPHYGSYIKYGTLAGDRYDAYYTIYHNNIMNSTDIEWNRTTRAGRVYDVQHFQDEDWHCWDEQLEDTECP